MCGTAGRAVARRRALKEKMCASSQSHASCPFGSRPEVAQHLSRTSKVGCSHDRLGSRQSPNARRSLIHGEGTSTLVVLLVRDRQATLPGTAFPTGAVGSHMASKENVSTNVKTNKTLKRRKKNEPSRPNQDTETVKRLLREDGSADSRFLFCVG